MTHDGPDDRELHQLLVEMRRSYNVPTEPPLDEMWDRIERERWGGQRGAGRRSAIWWIGMAAALMVGVGVGRLTGPSPRVAASAESVASAVRGPQPADSYDRTTAHYLGQTAALLVTLPAEARAGGTDRRFVARATELLTTTRLLLDSPAATDPKVRALLEDVELVLAQVAHLGSGGGRVELELIAQALEQRDLLPRLTSAAARNTEADD
jgi:hypothetical protein